MAKSLLGTSFVNGGAATVAGATEYWLISGHLEKNATEANRDTLIRSAGVLSGLIAKVSANSTTASSTIRTRKNAANGGQSQTIGNGATGDFEDTTGTDTVAAGDKICIQTVTGTGGTITFRLMSLVFDATTDTVSIHACSGSIGVTAASTTQYMPINGFNWNTVETFQKCRIRRAVTAKNMAVYVSAARATGLTVRLRKNGADGNLVVTCTNSTTGWFEDTSHSDSIAVGDDVCYSATTSTGTDTCTTQCIKCEFVSTDLDSFTYGGRNAVTAVADNSTTYYPLFGTGGGDPTGTESTNQVKARQPWVLTNFEIMVAANDVSSASTCDVRKGGVSTSITISITGSTTGLFADNVHIEVVTSTDQLNVRLVVPSVAGSHSVSIQNIGLHTNVVSTVLGNSTIMQVGGSIASTANTTEYWALLGRPNNTTTENDVKITIRKAGKLSKLSINLGGYSVASGTTTFTVRKNGADTASVAFTAASGAQVIEDLAHVISVAAGDTINLKTIPGAATGTFTIDAVSMNFTPDDGGSCQLLGCARASSLSTNSATRYIPLSGDSTADTTEAEAKTKMKKSGICQYLYVNVSANARTTDTVFRSRKNGANGNLVVTYTSGQTGVKEDTVNQDTIAVDDDYNFSLTTSTGAGETITWTVMAVSFFADDQSGAFVTGNLNTSTVAANQTRYLLAGGSTNAFSTESDAKRKIRLNRCLVTSMYLYVVANSVTANSTVTLRKNAAAGNNTLSIGSSATGQFSDTAHTDEFAGGDDINLQLVTGATGTSIEISQIGLFYKLQRVTKPFTFKYNMGGMAGNTSMLGASFTGVSTANTTQYIPAMGYLGSGSFTTTEAEVQFPIRKAGQICKLAVRISSYSVSAGGSTYTVRKNGVDTALAVSFGATGYFEDQTDTISFAAGDKLSIKTVPGGATGTFTHKMLSLDFIADDGTMTALFGISEPNANTTTSSTRYHMINGRMANNATEANAKARQRVAGTYAKLAVYVSANARTGNTVFKSRKNGADGNLIVTFSASQTGLLEDTANSDAVVSGDDYNLATVTPAGTESITPTFAKVEFTSDVEDKAMLLAGNTGSSNQTSVSTTNEISIVGSSNPLTTTTDYRRVLRNPKLILTELHVYVDVNTISATSTATLLVNGSASALTMNITASTTGLFSDTSHNVTALNGDTLSTQIVGGGTGTAVGTSIVEVYGHTGRVTKTFRLPYKVLKRVTGQAIKLDGSNDRVNCGNDSSLWSSSMTKFSWSMWIYPEVIDDGVNFRDILTHGPGSANGFKLQFRPSNPNMKWVVLDSSAVEHLATYNETRGVNRWYHFVGTYDSTLGSANIKLFIDKVQRTTADLTQAANASANLLISDTTTDLQGSIKDFRFWKSIALTQTDINNVYANDPAAPTPDYWLPMQEGSGTTITDVISGTKTASLDNGATWNANAPNVAGFGKSFTAKYNVVARVSKQFRFPYKVLQRVSKVFRFPYNVRQRISKVFRFPYNVRQRISKVFRFPYNVRQRISKSFIFKYNVAKRISKSFIFKYNVVQRISKSFIFKYNVAQRVSKSFTFLYNVASGGLTRISKSFIFKYNVQARVTKQFRFPYNVQQRISKQFRFPYNVVQRISKQFRFPYNVAARISKQFRFKYNVLVRVSKQFRFPYNVQQRITKQFRFVYNVQQRISKQFRFKYNVVARISKSFTFKYNVVQRVSKQFRFPYKVLQRVSKQFRFKYNVLVRVTKSFTFKYNVVARVSKNFTFLYNVISDGIRVSKSFTFVYNVAHRTSKSFTFKYNVRVRVSKQFRFVYNVRARVSKAFQFPYNVQQRISKQFTFKYLVLQRVSKQFRFKYNVAQRISKAFTFKYKVVQRVSKTFRFKYLVLVRVTKSFTFKYNVLVRVSKTFRFPYKVIGRVSKAFRFVYNILSVGIEGLPKDPQEMIMDMIEAVYPLNQPGLPPKSTVQFGQYPNNQGEIFIVCQESPTTTISDNTLDISQTVGHYNSKVMVHVYVKSFNILSPSATYIPQSEPDEIMQIVNFIETFIDKNPQYYLAQGVYEMEQNGTTWEPHRTWRTDLFHAFVNVQMRYVE